ncbi:6-phosphogluconolactonase [Acetobacter sp. AN02]|uniref:6-phosphogluconolactonase n=1 Tax=Acetobacter sp. AN02 TaxID=2894186 RepID=UPI0024345160|nr:6-phosphogluconolactonase [Acetobacter sp. AN02]MDG6093622.1 6-phosphogluconolactonase [Acetobacter sp. AN02]
MPEHGVQDAEFTVLKDADAVARDVADRLMERALAAKGPLSVALSGGSTPKKFYGLMAGKDYADRFPWERVHFFYGDDRFVPHDDPDSNAGMADRLLFSKIDIPAANIHPMPDSGDAEDAARAYERNLKEYYEADTLDPGRPLFDIVLLGLGENGHTASLFPRQPVLHERERWVATCVPDDAPHTRLTLTYPAIASSREVWFLVTGQGKQQVLERVRAGDPAEPASHIVSEGRITFLADSAAAGESRT